MLVLINSKRMQIILPPDILYKSICKIYTTNIYIIDSQTINLNNMILYFKPWSNLTGISEIW